LVLLVLLGIFFRVAYYFYNRAFWLDEAWLALDITNRSFYEIVTAENYFKPVPIGFAIISKIAISLLGNNEYIFRLFPLISGILSLFLYLVLLRRCASEKAIPLAFGFFALSPYLVYYSNEFKYYSSDVLIALTLYFFIRDYPSKPSTPKRIILYGMIGSLVLWVSHTALFILASLTLLVIICSFKQKELVYRFLAVQLLWVISFIFIYLISLKKVERWGGIHSMWEAYFWPWPPWSWESLLWLQNSFWALFSYPTGFELFILAGILFLLGAMVVWQRNRYVFWSYMLPFLVTLIASGLHKYPFSGRVILFLVPFLLFFVAEGLAIFFNKSRVSRLSGTILLVLLLVPMARQSWHDISNPPNQEDMRPIVNFFKDHQQDGDEIYINYSGISAFLYYMKVADIPLKAKITKVWMHDLYKDNSGPYLLWASVVAYGLEAIGHPTFEFLFTEALRPQEEHWQKILGSPRVWIILSHTFPGMPEFLLDCLDRAGHRLTEFKTQGSAIYLYNLEDSKNP